jgi:hypothetical protein
MNIEISATELLVDGRPLWGWDLTNPYNGTCLNSTYSGPVSSVPQWIVEDYFKFWKRVQIRSLRRAEDQDAMALASVATPTFPPASWS